MQVFIIGLLWILWVLSWMAVAIVGDPAPHKFHGIALALYRLVLAGSMLLLFTITPWPGFDVQYRMWDRAPSDELAWSVVAVAFIGFGLTWWATILRLIARKHREVVIERGPFKYVRHPFYIGLMLAAFATAAMFGRPSAFLGAIVMSLAFLIKMMVDDHVLRADSSAYDAYAERVWMLLPVRQRESAAVAAHASIAEMPVASREPVTAPSMPEPVAEAIAEAPLVVEPVPQPPFEVAEQILPESEPEPDEPEIAMEPTPPAAPRGRAKSPSDVLSRAVQLSLSLDETEDDDRQTTAGLNEAVAKD